MSTTPEAQHIERCPFCGGKNIDDEQGVTYRWRRAFCADCGARGGEVRTQVTGSGANTRALADARRDAFEEWNRRAQPPAPPAQPTKLSIQSLWPLKSDGSIDPRSELARSTPLTEPSATGTLPPHETPTS